MTTLKPIETLYKQTLKILDQKPISYHHCNIIIKYNLFNFDSFLHYLDACLIFKISHGLAPPPLGELYNRRAEVAGQLGQLPGETVLYRIDVVRLAKQSSQYGLQIIGTVSLLNFSFFMYSFCTMMLY